jgi:hypothetical protein
VVSTADLWTASWPLELQRKTAPPPPAQPCWLKRSEGRAPFIRNLVTYMRVGGKSFTPWQFYSLKSALATSEHKALQPVRTRRRKNKKSCPCQESNPALDLIITPNALSRLKPYAKINRKHIAFMGQNTADKVRPAFHFRYSLGVTSRAGVTTGGV